MRRPRSGVDHPLPTAPVNRGTAPWTSNEKNHRLGLEVGNARPHGQYQHATDLGPALDECRTAARRGLRMARDGLDAADAAIGQVCCALHENMEQITAQDRLRISDVIEKLRVQVLQITADLHERQKESRESLEMRSRQLDGFSIALFGRTNVGKSTLVEILTCGNGASIGKGAQRTTRDVRTYHWRGIKVADVPGVGAVGGDEDEELALDAARKADLVLFLITDDGPQPVEAKWLARVMALGKPVLGICNVKASVENEDDPCSFLRSPARWFDDERLSGLQQPFQEFADKYALLHHVSFDSTHLLSRYLATRPAYRERRFDLERASRFRVVENRVISEVIRRGKFLRIKSFIDDVVVRMLDLCDHLLDFSEQSSISGRVLSDKHCQVRDWGEAFERGGRDGIDTFVSKHINSIRDEIPSFSEDNYDRKDASERWYSVIKNHELERKTKKFVEKIEDECQRGLSEFARQTEAEIKFAANFAADRRFSTDAIFDSKRTLKWATTILSSGLGIAGLILLSGPLGWAAGAVVLTGWLASLFLDDHETKARKQRSKLAKRLHERVGEIESNLRKGLNDWFEELLKNRVKTLCGDLEDVSKGIFAVAKRQRELTWTLNREQKKLHRAILLEALGQLDQLDLTYVVLNVARVPGIATMLVVKPETTFPAAARRCLEDLLGEMIWFVSDGDKVSILKQAIGRDCDPRRVHVEQDIGTAHVPVEEPDAVLSARIRLAQQLTELYVQKVGGNRCRA